MFKIAKLIIFSITETWLTQNDAAVCKEITPNRYRLFHCPHTDPRGGGTALLCRESLNIRRLSTGEKTSFEFSEYMIDGLSLQLRLVIVYRPLYSAAHPVTSSTFFPEFSEYLESFVLSKVPICISGEFNVHLDVSDDADTIAFADLLESLCLTQHIKSPTHVMGHILDLIITRSSDNIIKGTPSPDRFLSDHCSVLCFLNVTKVLAIVKHINFRKLKSLDLVAFKNDIPGSDLCNIASNDCNEVAELYDNCMRSILDRHAPMTSKRVFARPSTPWMSGNIIEAKRQRRKAERKWRSSKCQSDLAGFKRKRNHVTFLMNEARRVYYCTLIAENSHDQKHMFKVSKKLLNITGTPVLPRREDKRKLAYEMGMFFIKIFDSLLFKLSSLSQEEVHDLFRTSNKKSCGLDPIPTKLLLDCLDVLLPTITKMINYSLEYGDFSSAWKIALVLP